jgi:hypothetical protein
MSSIYEQIVAFAEHSRAVHGTPTPRRSTELMGSRHA